MKGICAMAREGRGQQCRRLRLQVPKSKCGKVQRQNKPSAEGKGAERTQRGLHLPRFRGLGRAASKKSFGMAFGSEHVVHSESITCHQGEISGRGARAWARSHHCAAEAPPDASGITRCLRWHGRGWSLHRDLTGSVGFLCGETSASPASLPRCCQYREGVPGFTSLEADLRLSKPNPRQSAI